MADVGLCILEIYSFAQGHCNVSLHISLALNAKAIVDSRSVSDSTSTSMALETGWVGKQLALLSKGSTGFAAIISQPSKVTQSNQILFSRQGSPWEMAV